MAENYKDYHKPDIKLPFHIYFPDGSPMMETYPDGTQRILVRELTLDDVKLFKGLNYRLEQVDPPKWKSGIEESQTTGDKD